MTMSSKRCREPLPSLQVFPSIQPQQGIITLFERDGKCQKLMLGDEQTTCNRRWEEMDHELLICIMKRFRWHEWGHTNFIICKSWLSAFLDVLFPPGDILDLRLLDDMKILSGALTIRRFYHYLKLNLDRRSPNHYTKLILSEFMLHPEVYRVLAQRLPSLKSFVSPANMDSHHERFRSDFYFYKNCYSFVGNVMYKYWKKLEDAHCHTSMVVSLAGYCKSIRNLKIVGLGGYRSGLHDNIAFNIAKGFPVLDRFSISAFAVSFKGISMILDDHKGLSYLDMTHTIPVIMCKPISQASLLDYSWAKELSHRIAGVQTFLTCNRRNCPTCFSLDSPSF